MEKIVLILGAILVIALSGSKTIAQLFPGSLLVTGLFPVPAP